MIHGRFFSAPRRPADEAARQARVDACLAGAEAAAAALDALSARTAGLLTMPMASVSLIDRDRQLLVGCHGPLTRETSRAASFCGHTVLRPGDGFVVADAAGDGRFAGNPHVLGGPLVRFYAGVALLVEGQPVGALCVLDTLPHPPSRAVLDVLAPLADEAVSLLLQRGADRRSTA